MPDVRILTVRLTKALIQYGIQCTQVSGVENGFSGIQYQSCQLRDLSLCGRPAEEAEALNEMGRPDQAAVPLNIVRKRAGLPEVSGLSQETMREKIIHERRMELAFEGHRWFDMIRVNNGEYAIKFLHSIGKSNVNRTACCSLFRRRRWMLIP